MEPKMIEIIVNGLCERVPENSTISQLMEWFEGNEAHIIVEHNCRFVYPHEYGTTIVSEGSRVEFISPDFGG